MVDLFVWWTALAVLGIAFAPVAARIFPARFADHGRPFAKPLALVGITYASWLLTSSGIPHAISVGIAATAAAVASVVSWRRSEFDWRSGLLREEGMFLAALCFFAAVRALQPDIEGAEKYMDFAFFNTLLRAEHFPPQDPWMSAVPINYYYFGYLMFAELTRATGVSPAVAYNLSLATIGAISFTTAFSIGSCLSRRQWGGLLAAVAVTLIGNLDGAQQLLVEHRALSAFDYWRPTRVVPNTINEFPFFSLLHGDLHPHVSALVIDVALIGTAIATSLAAAEGAALKANGLRLGVLALLIASLALTNPWDLPVHFTLIGILALHRLWDDRRPFRALIATAAIVAGLGAAMVVLSLPFTRNFHAQFQGIGRVHERTALGPFIVVFGFLLVPLIVRIGRDLAAEVADDPQLRDLVYACAAFTSLALYVATQSAVLILMAALVIGAALMLLGPNRDEFGMLGIALGAAAAVALGACEIVFLRDPYGSALHRMNTVFKLYFQAWLLLALAFPALIVGWIESEDRWTRRIAVASVLIGLTASLCYPMAAIALRWNGRASFSLDGIAYLDRDHPSDGPAIRRLAAQTRGLPVVLEATGDPYSYYARVASNTGLPTVLGWANHESVWRGVDPRIERRKRDVDLLYRETDADRLGAALAQYRVRYVFVGELERSRYPAEALAKFAADSKRFERIIQSGSTEVFAVRDTTASE